MTVPGADRGAVPIEWTLGVALLVLPVVMLVAVFPTWAERQSAARLAAREAARVAALADDPGAAEAAGLARALEVGANHGITGTDVRVSVTVPRGPGGEPSRDGVVTATVEVVVPLLAVPGFGKVGGWTVSATHHEPLDRYRSLAP